MDGARFGIIQDENTEQKRQRRGIPDLKRRPGHGNDQDDPCDHALRIATAKIGLFDEILQLLLGGSAMGGVGGHGDPPTIDSNIY